jgi:hypothetical protein
MTLQQWADLGTVVGVLFAASALVVSAVQTKGAARSARASIWLELERMFAVHENVHQRLRPGGEWATSGRSPRNVKEWASVEDYMGLFEYCEIMIEQHLLDWHTFNRIYSYRLSNIMQNADIVDAKLVDEGGSWQDFLSLLRRNSDSDPDCLMGWRIESSRAKRFAREKQLTLQAAHEESNS